jgi:ketosteroid isomerase-like protein
MSQENVELTYRTFDALNRRDLDAYLALTDEDVEFVPRTSAIEGESVYRGHDGVRRWWSIRSMSSPTTAWSSWRCVILVI